MQREKRKMVLLATGPTQVPRLVETVGSRDATRARRHTTYKLALCYHIENGTSIFFTVVGVIICFLSPHADRHVGDISVTVCYPHMPTGMLGIYRLLFVCPQDFW